MSQAVNNFSAVLFKPVPGGWVYRAPNPRVFGDTPHYLVNDAQKAQIEAIVVPRQPTLFAMILVGGISGWVIGVTTLLWAFSGHEEPTGRDLAIMIALIALPLLAILPVAALIQRHRLAPVLAAAPLTTMRISYSEISRDVQRATPLKQLLNACIASFFACFAASSVVLVHLTVRHVVYDAYAAFWGVHRGHLREYRRGLVSASSA